MLKQNTKLLIGVSFAFPDIIPFHLDTPVLPPPCGAFRARAPDSRSAQRLRGKVTVNVEPWPGTELSDTFPP